MEPFQNTDLEQNWWQLNLHESKVEAKQNKIETQKHIYYYYCYY